MLEIVTDSDELKLLQEMFERELQSIPSDCVPISFRALQHHAQWSKSLDIWWFTRELENRWQNAFGVGRPRQDKSSQIICEVNVASMGDDRKIAGGYAKDGDKIFVVHRGNSYGCPVEGSTKRHFWANYQGSYMHVTDGADNYNVAFVAELGNTDLASSVAEFVHEVRRVRSLPVKTA